MPPSMRLCAYIPALTASELQIQRHGSRNGSVTPANPSVFRYGWCQDGIPPTQTPVLQEEIDANSVDGAVFQAFVQNQYHTVELEEGC